MRKGGDLQFCDKNFYEVKNIFQKSFLSQNINFKYIFPFEYVNEV